MMTRYALKIQYDGTYYVGYQVQPNGPTIQAALEKAIATMAKLPKGEYLPTISSGRTDSGVHALGQVIALDYPAQISPQAMMRALNSLLDPSIRVTDVAIVADDFHPRYHAVGKAYHYRLDTNRFPDPFKRLYTSHHPYPYDIGKIQTALKAIVGTHDFTSFCSTKTDKEDKVRTIYKAHVYEDPHAKELIFQFHGNGFLYNMIRIIVGTCLQIGDGLKPVDELERLLNIQDRNQAGPTAPPQGLYMVEVYYDRDPFMTGINANG